MINRLRGIRKRWIIISATALLLAMGLVSGVALAADARNDLINSAPYGDNDYGRNGKGHPDALLLRVAEILGVDQSTLESAFGTARSEQVDARYESYTGLLVASGTLTQDQADEADTWFDDRPDDTDWLTERLARTSASDQSTAQLTRLVSAGRLTQEEAEDVATWHADRPDFLPVSTAANFDEHRGRRAEHGKFGGEHRFGHGGHGR